MCFFDSNQFEDSKNCEFWFQLIPLEIGIVTYARDSFRATYSLELNSEVRCVSIVYKYTGRGIGFISVFQHYESEYYRIILGEKDKWNSAELSLPEVQTKKVSTLTYTDFIRNIVRRFKI